MVGRAGVRERGIATALSRIGPEAAAVDIISRPMGRRPQGGDAWSGYSAAWSIIATLLAGMLVWGGIGYLIDRLVGTVKVFLPIGLIVGTAGGIYLVYLRHGRENDAR